MDTQVSTSHIPDWWDKMFEYFIIQEFELWCCSAPRVIEYILYGGFLLDPYKILLVEIPYSISRVDKNTCRISGILKHKTKFSNLKGPNSDEPIGYSNFKAC